KHSECQKALFMYDNSLRFFSLANPALASDHAHAIRGFINDGTEPIDLATYGVLSIRVEFGPTSRFARQLQNRVWLLHTKDPQTIVLTVIAALSLRHGTMFGFQSTYFPELFGTRVRYTGISLACQVVPDRAAFSQMLFFLAPVT